MVKSIQMGSNYVSHGNGSDAPLLESRDLLTSPWHLTYLR